MTSPTQPVNPASTYSTYRTDASSADNSQTADNSQKSGYCFCRRVMSFFSESHMPSLLRSDPFSWKSISNFCKGLYERAIKPMSYISRHINTMLPAYLMKAGTGAVLGFIIGGLTPIGPISGTACGLLMATGWQLCVEFNTNRDNPLSRNA